MFTGLIEEIGTVTGIRPKGEGISMDISARLVTEDLREGDSVCINGACQTVTSVSAGIFTVFVSKITRGITTLGVMKPGKRVNLERAMKPSGRFGGHFVQGHVDGKGTVGEINSDGEGTAYVIETGPELLPYIAAKGSVTVDGISLTVVALTGSGFTLYLIPETMKRSVAETWRKGDPVNIEVDIIAKYVERMLGRKEPSEGGPGDLQRKLLEEGFI